MKTLKMAFLGGAALSVLSVGAQADDLADLKAQIESLNARVAQMEAAPQVPAGYSLLTISEGARPETPGLPLTAQERAAYGETATVISVLPTADAPATTTITWSGYARAALVYGDSDGDFNVRYRSISEGDRGPWESVELYDGEDRITGSYGDDSVDVLARGQIRVNASTDTAVGEVGVDIRMRANFNGNGDTDVYSDVAWGYWAMTPELTFGGGYAGSLGNVGYGYDGACTCYYTDNADVAFNPGDTTQLRLSYASGPFSMGVALEDASFYDPNEYDIAGGAGRGGINTDKLGVAGELKYAGDMFSGEISGVYRAIGDDYRSFDIDVNYDDLWQIGAGIGFSWDMFALSIGAAMGSGPALVEADGAVQGFATTFPEFSGASAVLALDSQDWWGVSALAAFNFNDAWHAELGAGYKSRDYDGDSYTFINGATISSGGADYDTYAVLGGIYYDPVPQLTLGLEAEWYTTDTKWNIVGVDSEDDGFELSLDNDQDNWSADFVAVWRF